MSGQTCAINPFNRCTTHRLWLASLQTTDKELEANGFLRIHVCERFQFFPHAHFHTQFLPQFALKTFLKGFAMLAFTPWELPKSAQVRAGVTLGDEKPSIPKDESGTDLNQLLIQSAGVAGLFFDRHQTIKDHRPMLL